jgi:hypothetical protein
MKIASEKGYGILEVIGFLAIVGGIAYMCMPTMKTIKETKTTILKTQILTRLEIAKNLFDSESKTIEKRKFDDASDEERFDKLSPKLGESDSIKFIEGSGIKLMKINKLGNDVEVE